MSLTKQQKQEISEFSDNLDFIQQGGLITDLDGTVIQQKDGRYFMPEPVKRGLTDMYATSCKVIIDSIRFPLSVINTFAEEWFDISKASVPIISLNGSQMGFVHKGKKSGFTFEEIDAFPFHEKEIDKFISDLDNILKSGATALAFYYPRDWEKGEIIWTPDKNRLNEFKDRYRSASHIYSSDLKKLHENLLAEDISMVFLVPNMDNVDESSRFTGFKDFYTHQRVDKLSGAKKMIAHLGLDIQHFIGAGDTPMDVFLKEVGLVLKVGTMNLNFECKSKVLQIDHLEAIGEVFTELADNCVKPKSH